MVLVPPGGGALGGPTAESLPLKGVRVVPDWSPPGWGGPDRPPRTAQRLQGLWQFWAGRWEDPTPVTPTGQGPSQTPQLRVFPSHDPGTPRAHPEG